MKGKRHTPEQAVRKLREGEKLLNAGEELGSVLGQLDKAMLEDLAVGKW